MQCVTRHLLGATGTVRPAGGLALEEESQNWEAWLLPLSSENRLWTKKLRFEGFVTS